MLLKKTLLAATVAIAFASGSVMADSWKVIQSYSATGGATTITQGDGTGATTGSVQAINSVNLTTATSGEVLVGSTQDADFAGQAVTMNQSDATATSTQAINRISAHTITGATQSLAATGAGVITLNQETSGASNVQAVNDAQVAVTITALTQNVSPTGDAADISLSQAAVAATGADNVQALNNVDAADGITLTALTQNANPTGAVNITMLQGTLATGIDNEQALNRLDMTTLTDTVVATTQDATAAAAALDMDQDDLTGAGSIQAVNLIKAGTVSSVDGNVSQTGSFASSNIDQTDTEAVLQAVNAVENGDGLAGTGGSVTQSLTVAGVSAFLQNGATGSHQAGNYIGNEVE